LPSIQSSLGVRSPAVGSLTILAHQGGWDEILLVGGPMLVIASLLVLAKRRVDAKTETPSKSNEER